MVEDIQIGMQQSTPNQVALSLQNQTQKRVPGGTMNLQHDSSKNGNIGGSKFVNRRGSKNRQQGTSLNINKRGFSNKTKNILSRFDPEDKVLQRKNQSADNLLNFHYMPLRSQYGGNVSNNGFRRRRTTTFNKEAFLQANCQFVVDYNVEKYQLHSIDPDVLVDWDAIQLIYFPTHEQQNCPICLYPPTAAKMTKCGHVYCWSCILHYLSLSEKSWNKCPICHEAIHEKDLKSVIPIVQSKFTRNGTIKMKLMKRPKNSLMTYAENDELNRQDDNAFSVWNGNVPNLSSKLMLASQEMVMENLLKREKLELTAQRSEALQEKSGEAPFIEMALKNIEMKMESHSSNVDIPIPKKEENPKNEICCAKSNLAQVLAVKDTEESKQQQAFSDEESDIGVNPRDYKHEEHIGAVVGESPLPLQEVTLPVYTDGKLCNSESSCTDSSVEGLEPSPKISSDYYYFYQAEDGQNIFINSLNARCLIEEYGSLESAPKTIIGQILDFESFSMTKDLRKRYRYLSHLPVSCEFVICEMMLRPPVLSKQTIHNFMGEFKKRKASRLKKSEEQRRHDLRANAELSREAGFRVYHTEEDEVEIDLADMVAFPSSLSPDELTIITATTTNNDVPPKKITDDAVAAGSGSFSQMLQPASPPAWPNTNNNCWGKSSSSSAPQAVYTRSLIPATRTITQRNDVDDDEDGPNIFAPSLKEMFTAAMVMQSSSNIVATESSGKKSTSKKGKKSKGTLLFATGAQRKY